MPTTTDERLVGFLDYLDNRLELKNTALDKNNLTNDGSFHIRMLLKTERAELETIRLELLKLLKN